MGSESLIMAADIVAMKGNPLENINLVLDLDLIMRAGIVVKSDPEQERKPWFF